VNDRWDDRQAATLADDLEELVYLSQLVGRDPTLTQPGGGNSSVKRRERDFFGRPVDVLRVKGSGTDLATMSRAGFTGLRTTDLDTLRGRLQMSDEDMMALMRASMLDPREPAPSVETPLHAVLPYRFIVHTHDFATQALTDTERPDHWVREALGEDVVYVDYARPGFPLAKSVIDQGQLRDGARGLVLGRHGLIAWGDSARSCYDNLRALINRAEAFLSSAAAKRTGTSRVSVAVPLTAERRHDLVRYTLPLLRKHMGSADGERPVILHHDDSEEALAFAAAPETPARAARGMSTPEHILRCGRLPLVVPADLGGLKPAEIDDVLEKAFRSYEADYRAAFARQPVGAAMLEPRPRVAIVPGLGLVTAMRDKAGAVVGNLCYRHVMRVMDAAEALGGFRFLNEHDAVEFEYWPLELAKLGQKERELERQVVLITGGASGIGRAIAERFLREGAHVVLADIDEAGVNNAARALGAASKDPTRVRAVVADASRPVDVARAVDDVVASFGGLDILVANAGFLQSAPLERIDEEVWDRHFDVNVKGYFLAAREAARVMKLQGRGVMLFNASKGAFAPTVDNAAYASSKAAVAALARNLATELGPRGIRVNYFNADFVDTPLMRQLIEQRAERQGVTVAAQTEEYRRRNLLQVGPIPTSAVAEAALFLVSRRSAYTTGAAFPIDGGVKEAMPR
jgi:rhamnulose-1-phosphate aldolase/alcohol dehydrogenase